jgi:hypothetical protein
VMARYGRLTHVLRGGDPEYLLRFFLRVRKTDPEATRALVEWGRSDIADADSLASQIADLLGKPDQGMVVAKSDD